VDVSSGFEKMLKKYSVIVLRLFEDKEKPVTPLSMTGFSKLHSKA